ncbi:MAG TPA: MaoC family dehydratase [Steroidobacteraceae bacterium]|nr:MaoC family dehydratase [Steroidobacteraceae bacterium]
MNNDGSEAASVRQQQIGELRIGQRFRTGTHTVTEEEIKVFAAQFDPQPFHLDHAAADASLFGGLVASGWHTAAITMRLLVDSGPVLAGGTVGLGADISWLHPVRPGDVLHVEGELLDMAPSRSRPERTRVTMRSETCNQRGTVVQVSIARMLVPRQ